MIPAGFNPLDLLRAIRAMAASADDTLRWMDSPQGQQDLAAAYPLDKRADSL